MPGVSISTNTPSFVVISWCVPSCVVCLGCPLFRRPFHSVPGLHVSSPNACSQHVCVCGCLFICCMLRDVCLCLLGVLSLISFIFIGLNVCPRYCTGFDHLGTHNHSMLSSHRHYLLLTCVAMSRCCFLPPLSWVVNVCVDVHCEPVQALSFQPT